MRSEEVMRQMSAVKTEKSKPSLCDILLMAAVAATLVAGYLLIGNQRYMIVCVMLILYSMAFLQ